jgi:hypothetical protein
MDLIITHRESGSTALVMTKNRNNGGGMEKELSLRGRLVRGNPGFGIVGGRECNFSFRVPPPFLFPLTSRTCTFKPLFFFIFFARLVSIGYPQFAYIEF